MNKSTLRALNSSIRKWEKIVDGSGVDDGTDNCPLCKKFYDKWCKGCPVFLRTGCEDCIDTPYVAWKRYQIDREIFRGNVGSWKASTPRAKKLAQEELRFLKSLLPEEE